MPVRNKLEINHKPTRTTILDFAQQILKNVPSLSSGCFNLFASNYDNEAKGKWRSYRKNESFVSYANIWPRASN